MIIDRPLRRSRRVGIFTLLLVADSLSRIPRARFGRIRIGKLGATAATPRRRGSPVCKKELSSNRINDPLASIYRRRLGCAGAMVTPRRDGRGRTNSSNCLRGTAWNGSCFSTSSFCRAREILFAFSRCREVYAPSPEV